MHGRISRDHSVPPHAGIEGPSLRRRLAATALASGVTAVHLVAAGWLVFSARHGDGGALASVAIVIIAGAGAWYGILAGRVAGRRLTPQQAVPPCDGTYWSGVGGCVAVSYALGLMVGGHPAAAHVFWTSLAVGHAAVWFALSGATARGAFPVRLLARRPFRAAAWSMSLAVMAPLASEVGLRVYAFSVNDPLIACYVTEALKLPPGDERLGQRVNSQGYWDNEFSSDRRGAGLRVAVLGDESVLCGDARTNFLVQIERQMPGVEILNFGVPEASPREYAAQLRTTVASCDPDAVVVCISLATDITKAPELPGAFDWRGLHLVQRSVGLAGRNLAADGSGACGSGAAEAVAPRCLKESASQLQICRVPLEASLQARWQAVFGHLDELLEYCRTEPIEPLLAVLPCEFQVDGRLRETLCRRAGYRPDQIDIDLPQRRLAAYANDRRVEMIDLLPHLRASRKPLYRATAAHFNRQGNSLAADILGDWLESRYDGTLLATGG